MKHYVGSLACTGLVMALLFTAPRSAQVPELQNMPAKYLCSFASRFSNRGTCSALAFSALPRQTMDGTCDRAKESWLHHRRGSVDRRISHV